MNTITPSKEQSKRSAADIYAAFEYQRDYFVFTLINENDKTSSIRFEYQLSTNVPSSNVPSSNAPSSDMISPQEKKMVLEFCSTWRSASEIAHQIGRNRQHTLKRIIKRMVNLGLLVMEFPDTPTSPKQRYKHRE